MKALDRLLWFLLSLIAIAYVLVAVYASTGRYFFPKLPEYQDDIVAYLERKTGFDWEIEGLEGSWQKFDPIIRGKKIRIVDKDQDSVFYLTDFMLRLDALASLRYREPRITDFKAGEIQLLLEHTAEGQWIIKNVPTRHSDQQISLEDFVSHFRAIGLEDVDIRVLYRGEVVDMPSVKLAFQRFGDHRRVHFEQSSEQAGDLHLIVESEHSFWDHQGALSIYAKARDLSVNQWLAVFTDDWRLNQVTGEWWIRREPEQSRWSGTALIDDSTLGKGDSDEWLLKNGSVQLAAEQSYDGDLRLWWHELAGVWREQALDMPEGYIDTRVEQGELSTLTVRSPRIDLGLLNRMLLGSELLGDRLQNVLSTLNPRGLLTSLELSLPLSQLPDGFHMFANLNDVSVDPWRDAPGIEHVNGFIEAEKGGGVVHLDTERLALVFPNVYENPIALGRSVGQVQWQIGSRVKVFSGPIAATVGDESLGARFALNLGVRKEDEASQMTLMIGSRDSDVEQSRQYIPSVLDKGLRDWLSASLKEGELIEGGFLYHGSLRSGEDDKRSIAAFFNVDKARLQFDPEWPALDSLAGMIHIDNHNVEGHIIDGFLYGTRLSSAAINVAREAGHLRLDLNAVAKGDAADGMKILKETPLASLTAEVTGDWQGKGSADYRLALNLPLTDKDPKAEKVDFSAHLHDADLFIPSLDIKFSEVSGNLNFISGRGLSSKNLTANLWGERFHIVAGDFGENMQFQSDQNVSVKLSGRVNAETLTQWTELPALSFLRGVTEAEIHLSVIDGDVSLTAESDLVGVQVELPDRYFKSAEQVQMTRLQWPLDDGPQDMRIEIDNKAYMQFLLENEQLLGGSIYLGGSDQSSSVELGKLTVSGAVDVFTLDAWDAALDRYIEAEQRLGGGQSADVPLSAEGVEIERLYAFGEQFDQSVISAHALAGYWHISIENQMLQGVISVPESDDPAVRYRASMQYLRLPGRDLNDSSTVQAETFWSLPDAWVPIDVTIDQLYMADEPYGSWAFQLTPEAERVRVHDLTGRLRGLDIVGGAPYAVQWFTDPSGQLHTEISLSTITPEIDKVIAAWNYETPIVSEQTRLALSMRWPGAPTEFSLAAAQGRLDFAFDKGQFLKASNSANNVLRVFGLFNFDTIVRRLQFDFSDLYGKGLSFDHATGALESQGHTIALIEPLTVVGPSSNFIMKGYVDVDADQVDAELVATLPVATSLPWVAALAGGLPAAAGVFVVSKLFQKQVDKLSSAVYSVKGPIDDPKIKFERLFDDSPNDTRSEREPSLAPANAGDGSG